MTTRRARLLLTGIPTACRLHQDAKPDSVLLKFSKVCCDMAVPSAVRRASRSSVWTLCGADLCSTRPHVYGTAAAEALRRHAIAR